LPGRGGLPSIRLNRSFSAGEQVDKHGWVPGLIGAVGIGIGVASVVVPCPAVAGPVQASVWIDVARADGAKYAGYRLSRKSQGMGVVTSRSGEIVTAAHVVWQADAITVTDAKGAQLRARVVCIDKAVDVAVLRAEGPLQNFATIRAGPAAAGELVGVVERPAPDESPRVASGVIQTVRWTSHGVPVPLIFSGIKGAKGMSGGGLFDAGGELVGIVIRIDGSLGYLSALPIAELCKRLSRCEAKSGATARNCPVSKA